MIYMNMLEMKRNEISEIKLDLLLIWIYLFWIVDLLITYYVLVNYWNYEVSPLYHMWWRSLLIFSKFLAPLLFLYLSKKINSYVPLYIWLGAVVFICYRNIFNLFMLK